MIAGLPELLDPGTLPVAARVAQVVIAGTVIAYVGALRPANARADLRLVVEMIQGDLESDVEAGILPGTDARVEDLRRSLESYNRLSPRAVVSDHWWGDDENHWSTMDPVQTARLDEYLDDVETAVRTYRRTVQPWQWLLPGQAPRHSHGNQRPRTVHANAAHANSPQREPEPLHSITLPEPTNEPADDSAHKPAQQAPQKPRQKPALKPQDKAKHKPRTPKAPPAPPSRERNLVFDGPIVLESAPKGLHDQPQTVDLAHGSLNDVMGLK